MHLFYPVRQRLGAMLMIVAGASVCCVCGALMSFGLAPRQQLEASSVARLPDTSLEEVSAAEPGTTLLATGYLTAAEPYGPESQGLVAYRVSRWEVSDSQGDKGGTTTGRWVREDGATVPDMTLESAGHSIRLHASSRARLSGPLTESIVAASDERNAEYDGDALPHGSYRLEGIPDGALVTVLGTKSSVEGILLEELFAGDRVAFEASEHDAARGLFFGGLVTMALSPILLFGGLLYLIFRRG